MNWSFKRKMCNILNICIIVYFYNSFELTTAMKDGFDDTDQFDDPDHGVLLEDNCCPFVQFATNDENFLNKTLQSKVFDFHPQNNTTNHPDHTDAPVSSGTWGMLLNMSYYFGPVKSLHHDDYVEYDLLHDAGIKLMNNATHQDEAGNTKKIWAIYDFNFRNTEIIKFLGSECNQCPENWDQLNAIVYNNDGTNETIKTLTVKCYNLPQPSTQEPSLGEGSTETSMQPIVNDTKSAKVDGSPWKPPMTRTPAQHNSGKLANYNHKIACTMLVFSFFKKYLETKTTFEI